MLFCLFTKISDIESEYYAYAQYELRRAKSTLTKHKDCIALFKREVGDVSIRGIKKEHFDTIKARLTERGVSRARIASVVYAMRAFMHYCETQKGVSYGYMAKVKAPPQERYRIVRTLTKDEVRRVVDSLGIHNKPRARYKKRVVNLHKIRWKCLLEVLWSSGMRISEALSLNRTDVDMEEREAIVCGKGGKYRRVFFSQKAIDLMCEYLSYRHDAHKALFVSHCEARRWSFSAAQNYLERWREEVNIGKHVTFHTLRRSFATQVYRQNKDINAASRLLGHSDIETTRRHYITEDWDSLKRPHKAAIDEG